LADAETYPPLNTLKPVTDDVWIVDGPVIRFGMPWPKMSFPTRMTVIRLPDGNLFIHSPTPLTVDLQAEIRTTGNVKWIVGPNRIHYWWIADWHAAFPEADVFLAPRIREQAKGRIDFEYRDMDEAQGYPWDADIATLPVAGRFMTEVEFFHRKSRTLILTDLIENFEARKLGVPMRLLAWLGGVLDPHGSMPRDMRLAFSAQKSAFRSAVEAMIAWDPERVVLAHGRWYRENGAAELRRAFAWLLK
jgi:hypothetical protein